MTHKSEKPLACCMAHTTEYKHTKRDKTQTTSTCCALTTN